MLAIGHALLALGIVGTGWLAEYGGLAAIPPPIQDAPNVLLVVLDTVGFDALNLGAPNERGLPQAHSPRLAELAASGVHFRRAISPSSWTLPAHASMFCGQPVDKHQATWHRGPELQFTSLAQELHGAGYVTGGFVGNNIYCSRETGLARGFLRYEDYPLDVTRFLQSTPLGRYVLEAIKRGRIDRLERKPADAVTQPFLAWLDGHSAGQPRGRPFFAFLNYFDAHDPYVAPPEFASHVPQTEADRQTIRDWWNIDKPSLTDQQVALGMYGYLDCIEFLDHHFGRLLDELESRGILENTIVIVTSDHGEHFGDHQLFGHGNSLYQPLVHVPLIISCPGRVPDARTVDQFVSLVDLPATVLDVVGLEDSIADTTIGGRSLRRFWTDRTSDLEDHVYTELPGPSAFPPNHGASPIFSGPMRAVIRNGFKYIRAGEVEELFDLQSDPAELHNLASDAQYRVTLETLRGISDGPQ
jgi:arylsulfatase A-like enzyme